MSYRAWIYIWSVLLLGLGVTVASMFHVLSDSTQWFTVLALAALATISHLFEAEAPGRLSYYPSYVFFFAGVLLLNPFAFVLLIAVPHIAELVKDRVVQSSLRRAWYLQPFNIAMHLVAGSAAREIYALLQGETWVTSTPSPVLIATVAVLIYILVNRVLLAGALILARGMSLRDSGLLDFENILPEFILASLGFVVAFLWQINPWYVLPAISPLGLVYRALMVPQLQQEAQTDAKTGLLNARHFGKLFADELARAQRFNRPLALIMADLDLMRDINNTYGHLAGDAVLAGIGKIIHSTIREYDIAARFGGEEFAIALPEVGPNEAQALAERIRAAIAAAEFRAETSATPIRATMSIGVACFPYDGNTITALTHEADVAVYQAKANGRNQVVLATDVSPSFREKHHAKDAFNKPDATETSAASGECAEAASQAVITGAEQASVQTTTTQLGMLALKRLLVGVVIATGTGLMLYGLSAPPPVANLLIPVLCAFAVIAELLQVDAYEKQSVSLSVGLIFAAALLTGFLGLSAVSAAIVLTQHLRRARRTTYPYKLVLNWATHVVAGAAPVLALNTWPFLLERATLPQSIVVLLVSMALYFVIDIALPAAAFHLSTRGVLAMAWRTHFRGLAIHYFVFCAIGFGFAVAYTTFGLFGASFFIAPILMLRYGQQQYMRRTALQLYELKRLHRQIVRANEQTYRLNHDLFQTLGKLLDTRDQYTLGHSAKVAGYAVLTAQALGLAAEQVETVRQAGLLHDIGKVAIPEAILRKPGKLTATEYLCIQQHALLGAQLLEASQSLRHLAPPARHHHERWDGTGYPQRVAGEHIPLEARILAVCDAVEAMVSGRPYRPGMPLKDIVAELKRCSGTQFDPDVVEAFLRTLDQVEPALALPSSSALPSTITADRNDTRQSGTPLHEISVV